MYKIQVKGFFDSAHFLKDYDGKCANLHGHRWVVEAELQAESLQEDGSFRGMIMEPSTQRSCSICSEHLADAGDRWISMTMSYLMR